MHRPAPCLHAEGDPRLATLPAATPPSAVEEPTDCELVARMARRDEAALGLLYDRWSALVYSVAARFVSGEDAEEVLEDTFWQAWRQAEQYRNGRGKVSTWLTLIARSRALDRRRKLRRAIVRPWTDADEGAPAEDAECPLEATISSEERGLIFRAIAMLPVEQEETVRLAYFGGLSQVEIARRLDQPIGTIKTRARLAAAKLRGYLSVLRDAHP